MLPLFPPIFSESLPFSVLGPLNNLTLSFEYSKPVIGVYETIDTNPEVRMTMINYYFDLIRDKWLLDDLNDILNYFTYANGKVDMIHNMDQYKSSNINNDTDAIAEEKVKYITKKIYSQD